MVEIFRKVLPKSRPVEAANALVGPPTRPEQALEEAHRLNAALKPTEAIALYRRALELEPSNAIAASELGSTLVDAGRAEEGFAFWIEHLEAQPQAAEVRLAYAGALLRVGELERAVLECELCLEQRPNWDAPYPPLIRALHRLGRPVPARIALDAFRSLARDPRIVAMLETMLSKA